MKPLPVDDNSFVVRHGGPRPQVGEEPGAAWRAEEDLSKRCCPRSRSLAGCGASSPTTRRCGCPTRRSTGRCTSSPGARCARPDQCLRSGRVRRVARAEARDGSRPAARADPGHADRSANVPPRSPTAGARALGGRPDHRAREPLRDRHPRGTHHQLPAAAAPARRPRRRAGHRRGRRGDVEPARPLRRSLDLGPGPGDWPAQDRSPTPPAWRSTSATRTRRGSARPTRTPTACCASTSPRAPTCRSTPPTTSTGSQHHSTTDPANDSTTLDPQKSSTTCCCDDPGVANATRSDVAGTQ